MDTPTSSMASAEASFIPSPTITVGPNLAFRAPTSRTLSSWKRSQSGSCPARWAAPSRGAPVRGEARVRAAQTLPGQGGARSHVVEVEEAAEGRIGAAAALLPEGRKKTSRRRRLACAGPNG